MPSKAALLVALKRHRAVPASIWVNFFMRVKRELFFVNFISIILRKYMRTLRLFCLPPWLFFYSTTCKIHKYAGLYFYFLTLRRAAPNKTRSPEPNNHTAAGIGTKTSPKPVPVQLVVKA